MKLHLFLPTLLLATVSAKAPATVIHVDCNATQGYVNIQDGIDAASEGDTVLVAPGTYSGYLNRDLDFGGANLVLISEEGPDFTIIDCGGSAQEPHRGVTFHNGESSASMLAGFTIKNGDEVFGGGVLCDSSSPTFTDIVFLDNSAVTGGGLFCWDAHPTLTDITFLDNWATNGAGMFCTQSSSPTLTDVTFSGNFAAAWGGGLCCDRASPTLTDVTFSYNLAASWGGGLCCDDASPMLVRVLFTNNSASDGGGMYCHWTSSPTLTDVTFIDNSAGEGGGMCCYWHSSPTLTDVTFTGNSGNYGGGMHCSHLSSPTLTRVEFSYNRSSKIAGGGLYCYDSCSPTLDQVTFDHNTAVDGGGLYCYWSSSPVITNTTFSENSAVNGAGLHCYFDSSPVLAAVTFVGNDADRGGALYCSHYSSPGLWRATFSRNDAGAGSAIYCKNSPVGVTNSIIAFGTGGDAVHCVGDSIPEISRSCIFGNSEGLALPGGQRDTANMYADPLFCNVLEDSLGLAGNSPCLPEHNVWKELIGARGRECEVSPVEGACYAVLTDSGTVLLRWVLESLAGITGLNVYRSTSPQGPFTRLNTLPEAPVSPGEFEDATVWPETTFWYELRVLLPDGSEDVMSGSPASVTTGGRLLVELYAPRPNPFSGKTTVQFDAPGFPEGTSLAVYNLRGELVKQLLFGSVERGRGTASWDGTDRLGNPASSGVYFLRLDAGGQTRTRKLLVVR